MPSNPSPYPRGAHRNIRSLRFRCQPTAAGYIVSGLYTASYLAALPPRVLPVEQQAQSGVTSTEQFLKPPHVAPSTRPCSPSPRACTPWTRDNQLAPATRHRAEGLGFLPLWSVDTRNHDLLVNIKRTATFVQYLRQHAAPSARLTGAATSKLKTLPRVLPKEEQHCVVPQVAGVRLPPRAYGTK